MVAKTIENILEKISKYMHQRNQNKKLFDMYRGKLSLTMVAMVNRENLFTLDKDFLCLYPRTPNFIPTDQIW